MPATWVACSDCSGSNGVFPYFQVFVGGENARAAITFGVVNWASPFGKPAGIVYPAGLKKGCAWSTPSSTIPILTPFPAVLKSAAPHLRRADQLRAPVEERPVGDVRPDLRDAGCRASLARSARGRETASPFRTTW